jgi:MFS transporter, DHA1 family, tetracycline resistance protein
VTTQPEAIEPGPTELAPNRVRLALGVIFTIMLMDIVGLTMMFPVSAYIVSRYSSEAINVTLLTVIYAAAQFFAAPLLGKLGDRYGRRPVLLISVFGSAVGYLIFGIGGALWVLFLSRLIDGITAGNMSTASAYIADVSKPEERAKNFTLIGIAWGVGLIVGPAVGSALGQINVVFPALAAANLSILSVVVGFFLLPESLPEERREKTPINLRDLNPFVSIGDMWRKPSLAPLLVTLCLFNFAFQGMNSIQALYSIRTYEAQPWQVGLMLVLAGIVVIGGQALFVQRAVKRFGEKWVAIVALCGLGVSVLLICIAPNFGLFLAFSVLGSACSTFIFPTITTLTTNRVLPSEIGLLMGVSTALTSLVTILGPLWAGVVYDHVMPSAPYWMGTVVFVLAAWFVTRGRARTIDNLSPPPDPLPTS